MKFEQQVHIQKKKIKHFFFPHYNKPIQCGIYLTQPKKKKESLLYNTHPHIYIQLFKHNLTPLSSMRHCIFNLRARHEEKPTGFIYTVAEAHSNHITRIYIFLSLSTSFFFSCSSLSFFLLFFVFFRL